MQEKEIGIITHYYAHIGVGIIQLNDSLKTGDSIHIKGHTSDFNQRADSMQIEHASVNEAKNGDIVGLRVMQKVHPHDKVYKIAV